MDLHTDGDIVVRIDELADGYSKVSVLQRLAEFSDARACALALFYLAFVGATPTEFVFTDQTYQTVVARTADLTEPARASLVAAARSVQARAAAVLTEAEIYFVGRRRDHLVPVQVHADLLQFKGADFVGRDFVEAVDRELGKRS